MGKNEIYKWMKRSLKNKVSITGKMLVIFLISGTLSQAGAVAGAALANGQATTGAENSLAIGNESKASVKEAYAIGTGAKSNSISAFAFGYHSEIGQNSDFAYVLGGNSKVGSRSKHSYAIGHYSEVDDDTENAYGIGWNAKVKKGATSSYAIGDHAETYSKNAYAIGQQANVQEKSDHAYAIGHLSKVDKNAQHSYTLGSYAKIGQGASSAYALGYESEALARQSYAIGHKASTKSASSYAFGDEAKVHEGSDYGYAIGHRAEVDRNSKYSYAIGHEAKVGAGVENVYAIGREAKAMAKNSLVFGSNSMVDSKAENTIAIGHNIGDANHNKGATEKNSVYLGNNSWHGEKNDTTIGTGSYANTNINGVTFNGYAGMNAYGVVTVGSKGQERRIQNVAAGWIDPKSTDAVNGSQLHAVAKKLTGDLKNVVKYDNDSHTSITLNSGGTTIKNVKTPTENNDAANKKYVDDQIKKVNNGSGTLSYEGDTGNSKIDLKTQKLKLKGDNKNTKTEVLADGTVRFGLKDVLSLDKLKIDGTQGYITGLANTTWNSSNVVKDRAASEGQLKQVEEGLNNKITQNSTNIQNNTQKITKIENELKDVVKYDKGSNKGQITLEGGPNGTKITNVKDGNISQGSKDAVNGGQIHDIKKDITNKIENVNNKVENNTKNIQNIQKELENVVKYDKNSNKGKVTLEGKNGGTTIDNVKDGKIAAGSKEAVNGGQLHDVEQKIKDVNTAVNNKGITFKGNSGQNTSKLGDTFNIKGSDSLQEADADDKNIRTSLKGNTLHMQFAKRPEFEKVTAGSGENKVEIGNDGVKVGGQAYITKEGLNANGKKITNVADGTNDSDAVNYGQLKKMMQNNGNVDEKIKTLDSKLSGAVAQAMAMANIPQVGDNKLFSIGVGGAYYNKQGGFAVGISGTEPSNTFIYKISAGVDTKKQWSIGAGFNLNFGTNKKANINNECCDLSNEKVKRLENENKNMKEQINDLKDLVKQLMNKIDQKPQIVEVEKVVEKVVEVPKVIEKKILVACFSTEKKCVIHGFAVDGRVPSKEEQKQLRDVASKINAFAESGTMSIVGHTDSDGSHAYNDKLSLQRATTVSRLLKEAGLSEALTVKEITGKGKREPMATNSTRVGKYLNRRVELLFDDIVIK